MPVAAKSASTALKSQKTPFTLVRDRAKARRRKESFQKARILAFLHYTAKLAAAIFIFAPMNAVSRGLQNCGLRSGQPRLKRGLFVATYVV